MRIVSALLAVAACAVVSPIGARTLAGSQTVASFEVGATIPKDVTLKGIDGKDYALGNFRGKIVFIHFWSIVCPSEKLAEPKCIELQKAYADKGVVQFAIDANQREIAGAGDEPYANLRDHAEKAGVNFLLTVDPGNTLTDLFGGKSTPHCFVIDRDGVLRYNGALDNDPRGEKGAQAAAYVRDAIEALLAGKPVPVATTKPYG